MQNLREQEFRNAAVTVAAMATASSTSGITERNIGRRGIYTKHPKFNN